ncbi:Subtilase family protein [Arachidicoccus rhizosphaerae]|uniref:Subtilase family protein n=1 Tax=Arachidicoccus rhizosphaerae TaxID=551991 RepID=A0A1H4B007_9BACT|nr:S8 family serine peptidase [Arachidicoccus rhizosphaerae]SEA41377.1 Subtilase family protein [Arachidicoccus rhizosphaerae]
MIKKLIGFAAFLFICNSALRAQSESFQVPLSWHMLDPIHDSVYGVSANRTYSELLKGKTGQKVIVGIVDSGADTLQEDLKDVLWHNPKEIPNDHQDNDKDGYVDDYYGWNFLGGKSDTSNVTEDTRESTRYYFQYKSQFENIKDSNQVPQKERVHYRTWIQAKNIELTATDAAKEAGALERISSLLPQISDFSKVLLKDTFNLEDVKAYEPIDRKTSAEKQIYTILLDKVGPGTTNITLPAKINSLLDSLKEVNKLPDVAPPNYRQNIVKDNYDDFNDKYYGNDNISAGDVMHGTHVSGIIGASRNNNLGMDGIADNVALIEVRTVPGSGDEHDKDVALAIRYAVDHGAKVINMSFGKPISPNRSWVEGAIRYAQQHDVLLVHAAGNDGEDITGQPNYPTQYYGPDNSKEFDNVITVGASGAMEDDLVADFSNFSKTAVDVFAPGVEIYSTLPGKDNYGSLSGTSMASPVVAGVAAAIRSYYPELSAPEVKQLIMASVTKINFPVINPATGEKVKLSDLCVTGGIVNLYNAIKMMQDHQFSLKKTPGQK